LTEALKRSGVDPSQANISVEINMDRRDIGHDNAHDISKVIMHEQVKDDEFPAFELLFIHEFLTQPAIYVTPHLFSKKNVTPFLFSLDRMMKVTNAIMWPRD
jgi:hypothetical protein